jgi:HK97 family phage major capsid protein
VAPNRIPGIYTPDMPALAVRSAFLNLQTQSNVIQFFRELTHTNNAAFVAEASATGSSTGLKPESALTFEADTAIVETLANWIAVTNQTLDDVPQMRGIVEGRLVDGVKLVEDDAILTGNGTPPNIKGLLNTTNVQDLDSTYFGANPVEGAGDPNEDFDRITRARRLIRTIGRARPSFVMLSPADLERLVTITDANKDYYSGSPFGDLALTRMRGLQVIETEALDEGTAVVGDGRMAAVFDRMAATVTAGWQDQQFVRNMITLLAEERLAFAVFRPAAFAIVELAG